MKRKKVADAIERVEGFANEWELNPQNTGTVYSLVRTRKGHTVELALTVEDLRTLALAARFVPDKANPEEEAALNAAILEVEEALAPSWVSDTTGVVVHAAELRLILEAAR